MTFRQLPAAFTALSLSCIAPVAAHANDLPSPDEIREIAQEALVYGLPIVMGYGVMYDFAIDKKSPNFKAPINQLFNEARTFTSADTGVVTPNSDTPYSFDWMDLRAEPMVICIPEIEKDRYYSVMLTSLYTYNFGYLGSRTTGNGGGCYAVAGPDWTLRVTPAIAAGLNDRLLDTADLVAMIHAKEASHTRYFKVTHYPVTPQGGSFLP
jgi:hypothetical protein